MQSHTLKKNIYIDSDSDDPKSKKTKTLVKQTESKTSKAPSKLPQPTPEKKKATSAIDFFGSSPVQRSGKKPARKVQVSLKAHALSEYVCLHAQIVKGRLLLLRELYIEI